jgi:type II secretory pathway component GspD/PulD (secretin)
MDDDCFAAERCPLAPADFRFVSNSALAMNHTKPLSRTIFLLVPVLLLGGQVLAQQPAAPPASSVLSAPAVQQPPFQLETTVTVPAPAPTTKAAALAKPIPMGKGEIMLNFQGASLNDVLNYLSEAAGFVIVQEAPVSGTVNVVSRQPINPEEAVDLVNSVLIEKGYVAIRNGRILKIVRREGAQKRDLPVQTGSDPEKIPRNDGMVTQILPLRFGEAAKLVENLRPLLPDNATITANESSNSILMTDTQTHIRRMAEIIRAIDTSVASISTIHVYPLQFANAKELATVITQLFANNTTSTPNGSGFGGRDRRRGGFPGFGGFPGGGDGNATSAQSEARQANSRVIAVADDQSNSLIVSAPEDLIPQISDIVTKIDTSTTDVTSTRIFNLIHADAVETADIINTLYSDATSQASTQSRSRNGNNNNRGPGGPFPGGSQAGGANGQSERALMQARVVAVGDPRTNALLVNAARDAMAEIAEMIGRLDATDAKKQHVYVHSLEHADVDSVAGVLRGMLGDQSANATQTSTGRLTNRSVNGAAMDTSQGTGGGNNRSQR